MSYFAELDTDSKVIRVLAGDPSLSDADALQFMIDNIGGTWVQTSYNARIRGKYAGKGDYYDSVNDIFVAPKPFPSWIQEGSYWVAPKPYPTDDKIYTWNESKLNWEEVK